MSSFFSNVLSCTSECDNCLSCGCAYCKDEFITEINIKFSEFGADCVKNFVTCKEQDLLLRFMIIYGIDVDIIINLIKNSYETMQLNYAIDGFIDFCPFNTVMKVHNSLPKIFLNGKHLWYRHILERNLDVAETIKFFIYFHDVCNIDIPLTLYDEIKKYYPELNDVFLQTFKH